jgi:Na+/H+ antiporter NhaC
LIALREEKYASYTTGIIALVTLVLWLFNGIQNLFYSASHTKNVDLIFSSSIETLSDNQSPISSIALILPALVMYKKSVQSIRCNISGLKPT